MTLPITKNWRDWHITLNQRNVPLREALANLHALGAKQAEIPLMVQLVENPSYDLPGGDLFHGRVDLKTHDLIHIILGRGLLMHDEAFTIGFTMGSTNRVTTTEEVLYTLISKFIYPNVYQFDDDAIRIFRDATKLGYISDCTPLNQVDFDPLMDQSLDDVRKSIGIETDLIRAYYAIEKRRCPRDTASQRLLD
jgi:hypothetical protein